MGRGELQLSVLSLLGPHLNAENAAELFAACSRKSCEQVELLLAARFPKPDVREAIRRLSTRAEKRTPDGGRAIDAAALANPVSPVNREANLVQAGCPEVPMMAPSRRAGPSHPAIPARRRLEPLSADRFGVRFTADAEFRELLEEVRALASHREPH